MPNGRGCESLILSSLCIRDTYRETYLRGEFRSRAGKAGGGGVSTSEAVWECEGEIHGHRFRCQIWLDADGELEKTTVSGRLAPSDFRWLPWSRMIRTARNQRWPQQPLYGLERGHPRGRPPLSEQFYATVAADYRAHCAAGSRRPSAAVAAERGANVNTVAGWVRRARQRGYLPPGRLPVDAFDQVEKPTTVDPAAIAGLAYPTEPTARRRSPRA